MAPGCLEPDASTFLSQFHCWRRFPKASDTEYEVDCNAQTSELGRLSSGKGGLPLWPTSLIDIPQLSVLVLKFAGRPTPEPCLGGSCIGTFDQPVSGGERDDRDP